MQETLPPCKSCSITKAKQKNVWKTSTRKKAEKPVECIFYDQSMIRAPKGCNIAITSKNWHLLVNQTIEYKNQGSMKTREM